MSLDNYGVAIGPIMSYYRDGPDESGKYSHGHIQLETPDGIYNCAIDVDTPNENVGIEYRIVNLKENDLSNILFIADGFTDLNNNSKSGALDYIRSKMLHPRLGCLPVIFNPFIQLIMKFLDNSSWSWTVASGEEALNALEGLLSGATKAYIFGEPFDTGLGVHNIHQNQGDPVDSLWGPANGTWQDGATIIRTASGKLVAFLNKFTTQSYKTDNYGDPLV